VSDKAALLNQLAVNNGTPVRKELLPYGRQFIDDKDIKGVTDVLRSGLLTTGPKIPEFEQAFAEAVDANYAVVVSSGTAALHSAMKAAGVGPGDEVITTPLSFVATANCVRYQQATVVFADVEPDTLNIDPERVEACITPKTKAVLAVDYTGRPANLSALRKLCRTHGLVFIEDAAHSLGATYMGQKIGNIADLTTFSMHPVKHITTGEGGVVTTNDERVARHLSQLRNHGLTQDHIQRQHTGTWEYDMKEIGYNYRHTDYHCALGISQLQKLPVMLERRREIARKYRQAFADVPEIGLPVKSSDCEPSWHLYVVRLDLARLEVGRKEIFNALRAENIGVNVHYIPIPWLTYYQNLGHKKGGWPVAEEAYWEILSLPIWPGMTDADVDDVVMAVQKVIVAYRI
jgi:UDP-4-amino-4,6-dideoxy-N-acetyl-beta-L-altrosamine transaminase